MGMKRAWCAPLAFCALVGCASSTSKYYADMPSTVQHESTLMASVAWDTSAIAPAQRLAYDESFIRFAALDEAGEVTIGDLETGRELTYFDTDARDPSPPALSGMTVVFGDADGYAYAYDLHGGNRQWKVSLGSAVIAAPIVDESQQLAWFVTQDGATHALNLDQGERLWSASVSAAPPLTLHKAAHPVRDGNLLYVGGADGQLRVYGAKDGALRWAHYVATPRGRTDIQRMVDIIAPPLLVDNHCYVVSYQGKVIALTDDGSQAWEQSMSSLNAIATDTKNVYLTDTDGVIWALDAVTGYIVWSQAALEGHTLSDPVISQGALWVGDERGGWHAFSLDTGEWRKHVSLSSHGIVRADNTPFGVRVLTERGELLALDG